MRGTVASHITVREGAEDAIAAALGTLAEAIAVDSVDDAVDAIRWLRDEDAGRARFVVADASAVGHEPRRDPAGRRRMGIGPHRGLVGARVDRAGLRLRSRRRRGPRGGARLSSPAHHDVVAVTRRGDLLGARNASGGAGDAPSIMHLQAAFDDACHKRDAAAHQAEQQQFALRGAAEEEQRATAAHEATLARLNESDARMSAVAEQLGHLSSSARSAAADAERLESQIAEAGARIEANEGELAGLVRASRGRAGGARADGVGHQVGANPARRGLGGGADRARQGDRGEARPAHGGGAVARARRSCGEPREDCVRRARRAGAGRGGRAAQAEAVGSGARSHGGGRRRASRDRRVRGAAPTMRGPTSSPGARSAPPRSPRCALTSSSCRASTAGSRASRIVTR